MSEKRVVFTDAARGLAVNYFIWCHTVNIHHPYWDTWAMPLCFLVIGFFKTNNNMEEYDS